MAWDTAHGRGLTTRVSFTRVPVHSFRQHLARRELQTRRMAVRFAFRDRVKRSLVRLQAWVRRTFTHYHYRRKKAATLAVQVRGGQGKGGGGACSTRTGQTKA